MVDRFEEIFTLCRDRAERCRFIDLLLTAQDPDSRLRVVIAIRADFCTRCTECPKLADTLRGVGLRVGPMTAEELRDVTVRPAQAAGVLVERELTWSRGILGRPGELPLLSHVLLETWRRRRGRILTPAAADTAGSDVVAKAEEMQGSSPRHNRAPSAECCCG
ncbi:hypothetical protein AB0E04_49340 [Streptomyces sp. NPDC048251]|uniref:nSTAND1 domain-containing NTPase n=1 Tax=Streptomyces sp. NPDC048251 TaxID=3154501 RepID=UPI00341393AF